MWEAEAENLKIAISAINRLRPRFVIVSGDLTHAAPGEPMYAAQAEALRKSMARVSDSIPVLYLPGNHDIGNEPTEASLAEYRVRFGADYYGFWYGGLRCIVLNSTLMIKPHCLPAESRAQDLWFAEEIEQAKLSACHVMLFTHHPWFLNNAHEPDDEYWTIPRETRLKWLSRLQHNKVSLAISGHYHRNGGGLAFPDAKKKKKNKGREEEGQQKSAGGGDDWFIDPDEEPKKPSEIIAEAKRLGELEEDEEGGAVGGEGKKGGKAEGEDGSQSDGDDEDDDDDDEAEEEDGKEGVEAGTSGGGGEGEKKAPPFKNVDLTYPGPEQVITNSVGLSLDDSPCGVRLIMVYEEEVKHKYYALDKIPTNVIDRLP